MRPVAMRRVGSAALAGAFLAAGAVPYPLPVLTLAFPPLLLLAIEGASPKRAFLLGGVTGFVANAIALAWVPGLLVPFAGFPWIAAIPVAALLWLAQALPFAVGAAAAVAVGSEEHGAITLPGGDRTSLGLALALPPAFTYVWTLFPWHPAVAFAALPSTVQLAEVTGPAGLELVLVGVSLMLFEGARRRDRRWLVGGLTLIVLVPALGLWRMDAIEARREGGKTLPVGVVQPSWTIQEKRDRSRARFHLEELWYASAALEAEGAAVVVWPETAHPFPVPRTRREDRGSGAVRGGDVRGPLLVGAITRGTNECERWNSVLAIAPSGRIDGIADKVRLMLFGETVPLWHVLPPLRAMLRCPGLMAGRAPRALPIADTQVGVLNCYEDVLAHFAREVAQDEPGWLVNVTNDAWFGDTREPHLHHLVARLRAVETRRDLVRAVNTGVSGHITASGAERHRTPTFEPARFVADVRLLEGRTLWVRLGDLTSPALLGGLFGMALARRRRAG